MFNRLYKDHAEEVGKFFVASLVSYFRYLLISGVCFFLHALFDKLKINWLATASLGLFVVCSLFCVPAFSFYRKSENGYYFMDIMFKLFGALTPAEWLDKHRAPDFLTIPCALIAMIAAAGVLVLPIYLLWLYCPALVEIIAAAL